MKKNEKRILEAQLKKLGFVKSTKHKGFWIQKELITKLSMGGKRYGSKNI